MMKKFLALTLLLGSSVLFVPSVEAKTTSSATAITASAAAPQIWQNRRRNRRVRVVNRTRIVRRGYATYREVWQYRYRANGTVITRLLSRTRIR